MSARLRRTRRISLLATGCATLAALTACSSTATSPNGTTADSGSTLKIVYFASATANGFSNAVWQGLNEEAKKLGGKIQLKQLDGNFDATTQFNQIQDAATSKQYDGAILLANDTVGSAPAVKTLISSGAVVSNVLNPLGPDLESLKPQVNGLYSVIADPSYDTTLQAQQVVKYCTGKATCTVVILIGGMKYPFDKARYNAYRKVLDAQPNIKVLTTGEGNYDRNQAVTTMGDILQAHPKFDVLLSATDQETLGAQVALKQAGWDLKTQIANGSFYINSLGGAKAGVAAVRAGEWNATVGNFPETAGKLALEQVVNKLRGKKVTQTINLDKVAPVPLLLTADVLNKYASFTGEWSG